MKKVDTGNSSSFEIVFRWLGPFSLRAVPQPFSPFPPQTGLSLEASLVVSLVINSSFLFCFVFFAYKTLLLFLLLAMFLLF